MPEKRKRFDIFSEDEIKQKRLIRIRMELGTMVGIRIELYNGRYVYLNTGLNSVPVFTKML